MGIWQWIRRQFSGGADHSAEKRAVPPKVPSRTTSRPAAPVRQPSPVVRTVPSPSAPKAYPPAQSARVLEQQPRAQRVAPELPPDLLQFSATPTGAITDVVVGFDFGTSSAKVAIQTPYTLGGRTIIVDFGPVGHDSCTYLLPATVHRDSSNRWHLVGPKGQSEHRRHLKLPLLGEIRNGQAPDNGSTAGAVAFVALALREARRVFLQTQADTYGRIRLRWAMNLGIPSAGYDDEGIRSRFLEVARAAWLASFGPEVNSTTLEAAIAASKTYASSEAPIAVVPEVAAEMVGYARSRYRRPGLHAVIDIGASTLDVCGIELLAKDGEDAYELLTADVRDFGFLELHSRRMGVAGHRPPFDAVPNDLVAPFVGLGGLPDDLRKRLERCDREYVEAAAAVVIRTLAWLRKCRAPGSPAWREGLPLFVTGGGADSHVANQIIRRTDERAKGMWVNYRGLVRQPLPMDVAVGPADVANAGTSPRMAVAYGLSFPEINIGRIVPPNEIPDVEPEPMRRREWQRAYIDKDAV